MRIHDAYTKLDRTTRPDAASTGGDAGSRATGASSSTDASEVSTSVVLSARARELSALAGPSAGRIAALRDHVLHGTLPIDAHAIAAKLLGDEA